MSNSEGAREDVEEKRKTGNERLEREQKEKKRKKKGMWTGEILLTILL